MKRYPVFVAPLLLVLLIVPELWGQSSALTQTIDVRSLSVEEARQGREVSITGVIIYVERSGILVQDSTGSTFFRPTEKQMSLKVGDEVEVRGRTQMGRYFAGIGPAEVRILRRGQSPSAISVGYDDIVSARYFYQHVAVEGIVRSIEPNAGWSALRLAVGSRIMEVRVSELPPPNQSIIDAKVRIQGISAGSINDQRQLVETFIRMQSWKGLEVLDPPLADESVPRILASELLAFRPEGRRDRRIAVAGTVTAVFPDGEVYLQDTEIAFAARLNPAVELSVGDRVDLVGFAEVFQFAASVVDAKVRHREPGKLPRPIVAGSPDALNSSHDARLVTVDARVADAFKAREGYTLVLSGKKRTIQIYVTGGKVLPEPESLVRATGICHVEVAPSPGFVRQAGSIHLQARSAEDVVVLEPPQWWTTRKLILALGILGGLILVTGMWNVALRRQVRRKTEALRERIEAEAILEERQRIAQEFHDTLEQDLTGLGLRLDTGASRTADENGRQIMRVCRNLVARIQAETTNIVSNLRDTAPFESDLATSLEAVVKNSVGFGDVEVRLHIDAPPPALSGTVLHHLHMIARESVNNALKHAAATQITIHVAVDHQQLVMKVSDDGRGLAIDAETWGKSGHFGCIGIRERARKIGATVAWHSGKGQGTTVEITLPLNAPGAARAFRRTVPGRPAAGRNSAQALR